MSGFCLFLPSSHGNPIPPSGSLEWRLGSALDDLSVRVVVEDMHPSRRAPDPAMNLYPFGAVGLFHALAILDQPVGCLPFAIYPCSPPS